MQKEESSNSQRSSEISQLKEQKEKRMETHTYIVKGAKNIQ